MRQREPFPSSGKRVIKIKRGRYMQKTNNSCCSSGLVEASSRDDMEGSSREGAGREQGVVAVSDAFCRSFTFNNEAKIKLS